jgi:hypothetical protein
MRSRLNRVCMFTKLPGFRMSVTCCCCLWLFGKSNWRSWPSVSTLQSQKHKENQQNCSWSFRNSHCFGIMVMIMVFLPLRCGGSSTHAWMRTYVSILRIPHMMWVWRVMVECYVEGGKLKNSERNLSQCHFGHHKSHMDWPGHEPGPPRWEAGD